MNAARAAALIAIGSNLPHQEHGSPSEIVLSAIRRLSAHGMLVERVSPFYETPPVPVSDQPWYVNAAILALTRFDPEALLGVLHGVEREFGRERSVRNAARILDLDLLAHSGEPVRTEAPVLPHPRLHERGFVLLPLRDIAPDWRHPVIGRTTEEMLAALPDGETAEIRRMETDEEGRGSA